MSIRARLMAGLLLLGCAMATAAGTVAYFLAAPAQQPGAALHANRIALALAAGEALLELNARAMTLEAATEAGSGSAALRQFWAARTALAQQVVFLDRQFGREDAPLSRLIAGYTTQLERVAAEPFTPVAAQGVVALAARLSRDMAGDLAQLIGSENRRSLAQTQAERRLMRRQLWWVLTAVLGALLLMLLVAVRVQRSLLRPLGEVGRGLHAVLAGRPMHMELAETQDEFGDIVHAIRKLRAQGEHIRRLAYFDAATALPNRNSLDAELRDVRRLRSSGGSHGLVLIGVDTYNNARNAFGVRFAEELMRNLASQFGVLDSLPTTLFRYDAATFAIVVDRSGGLPITREDLKRVAAEAFRRLSMPTQVGGEKILVSASLGASLFPDDARDPDELVNICGEVLRQARAGGSGQLRFGERGLTDRLRQQLAMSEQIRVGIRDGRFEPFFQPIVDVEAGRLVGAEILVRWRHPDGRVVLPGEFIVVAEETELIRHMTDAVLIEGCRIARSWIDAGLDLSIAFNLSARMLTPSVVDVVGKALESSGLQPQRLMAEVTETALFGNLEEAFVVLEDLRKLGVRLCLDDFGTGYSSLSHLLRFPVERIKIDPMLSRAAVADVKAAEIVRAMVQLSERIGIQLIAEGIETLEDVAAMRRIGCRYMQGFQFSPALPHAEFLEWARRYG